jgi:hypothetical protein
LGAGLANAEEADNENCPQSGPTQDGTKAVHTSPLEKMEPWWTGRRHVDDG